MISIEFIFMFLAFSIPLVCTPGPGNLILAMSGARSGLKGTLPLIAGIDLAYIVFTLMIGFGLGELFVTYPSAYLVLKYAGGLYLIYLSYKIWNQTPGLTKGLPKTMGFKDGIILTALNPKAHLLMILMFSQFMRPEGQLLAQVFFLTIALALVNIPNHFVWSYSGEFIFRRLNSKNNVRTSNRIFSVMLFFVAIYILIG